MYDKSLLSETVVYACHVFTINFCLQTFQRLGYTRLLLQIGRGEYEPIISSDNPVAVDYFRYKDSIAHEIKHADLIISHAGI